MQQCRWGNIVHNSMSTIFNNIADPESGVTMPLNIVDNYVTPTTLLRLLFQQPSQGSYAPW